MNLTENETLLAHVKGGGTPQLSLGTGRWPKPCWEGDDCLEDLGDGVY